MKKFYCIIMLLYTGLTNYAYANSKTTINYNKDFNNVNYIKDYTQEFTNEHKMIIFFFSLTLIFSFFLLIKGLGSYLRLKINKEWVRFGILTLVAILLFDLVIILNFNLYDYLILPSNNYEFSLTKGNYPLGIMMSFVILFPLICLLRYFELLISKSAQKATIKTIFIFISTCFVPFVIMTLIFFFGEVKMDMKLYSNLFFLLCLIAIVRTFTCYFTFKEQDLTIENEKKLSELRILNSEAEVKLLQSQINPHFLYNSLNSIASLAHIDAFKTEQMALALSDLFKYTINRSGKKVGTVSDEIEMVKNYLSIEKIRFGERLEFTIQVDKTALNEEIPMFILQPLVENAVKHGISKIETKGNISIHILKHQHLITIEVFDNGPKFPEGLISGHGLQSVYDLLRLSYGDKANLKWENTPKKGITISIDKTV